MTRATDAFDRLTDAMQVTDPACKGDDRFVLDDIPGATLAPICRTCEVFDACAAYAGIERPKAGFWAGKTYRTNTTKKDN